jgi:uncharacterized protein YndB with AHSA1/START domain
VNAATKEIEMNAATLIEPGTVKMERLLPGPVERVWAYLTESEKRAKWLAAGEFDLRLGGKIHLQFDNSNLPNDKDLSQKDKERGKGSFEGKITRLEPMRVLAHTWNMGGDTEVTYELTPAWQGCPAHCRTSPPSAARPGAGRHGRLGRAHRHPCRPAEWHRAAPLLEDA